MFRCGCVFRFVEGGCFPERFEVCSTDSVVLVAVGGDFTCTCPADGMVGACACPCTAGEDADVLGVAQPF